MFFGRFVIFPFSQVNTQFTFPFCDLDKAIVSETESASRHVYCLTVRIDMTRLLQSALYSERPLLIGQLSSHPIGQPPHS